MADSGDFRGPAATSARSGAGIISRIRLESLMCHSSLGIELGDWVNFITGQNGKCDTFGCRAKEGTQRAATLKDFIKTGCRLDAAAIPAATKADLRAKISHLEDQLRKAKKKIGEENIQKAVKAATEVAEAAASEGKAFCVSSRAEVGLDTTAVREAVIKVMDRKGLAIMVFSTDEASSKAVVYAGVPSNRSKDGLAVLEWLTAAMEPLKGKGGGGKNGVAQGQGSDASRVEEAIDIATKFAAMKLR